MEKIFCNKNRELAHITVEKDRIVKIGKILDEEFLPLLFRNGITPENMNDWLKKRNLPTHREGLNRPNMPLKFGSFFSLSDQYWFKSNSDESWEQGNFFTNKYSDMYSRLTFYPWTIKNEELNGKHPDLTTNGQLRKTWLQNEDLSSDLYKARSTKLKQEPISEVIASDILKKLNVIDFVEYELAIYGLTICSKCHNFIDQSTEFVPATHIFNLRKKEDTTSIFEHIVRNCEDLGIKHMDKYLHLMLAVDNFLGNVDRHMGNFGIIRNVDTGKFIGPAPLFDFGSAFSYSSTTPKKFWDDKDIEEGKKIFRTKMDASKIDIENDIFAIKDYPFFLEEQRNIVLKKVKMISRKQLEMLR